MSCVDYVVQGNIAQAADAAFVNELKAWIRFNGAAAVRTGDGLYSLTTGNPNTPTWIGDRVFGWIFTTKDENDKAARQVRSSAGIAVFIGQSTDKAHWVDGGRCYARFALQATALGIRNRSPMPMAAARWPAANSCASLPKRAAPRWARTWSCSPGKVTGPTTGHTMA